MRTCPVCGESFGDDLSFCDVDGTPLTRDPADAAQAKNKLWSILGVALVLVALGISALSVIFLPKGRVSSPVVSSAPQPASTPPSNAAPAETASNLGTSSIAPEPESLVAPETVAPELKKKDPALGRENANLSKSAKAAAVAAEEGDKPALPPDPKSLVPATANKPEPPTTKPVSDKHDTEPPHASAPPPTDPKTAAKTTDNSNSKKKVDDKDKKKGGLFKVFKKIFGKD